MKKGFLMKFSLLSISLVLTSASCISGNIPEMAKSFPNVPLSSIEFITTIPALMVLIFIILSNFFVKYIGEKKTVIVGLVLALISGIIPIFSNNFIVILISRAGLGAGFGLFNSLAVSMISNFFDGFERAKLIGFQSAFQSLGTAFLAIIAGQLLKINWHISFVIYLIIVPIIILFILFVPEVPKIQDKEKFSDKSLNKINYKVLGYASFLIILIIIFGASQVKLAQLLVDNNYGDATDASNILSIMSIGGMLAGFAFGTVFKFMKKYILPFSLLIMALAYFIFSISNSIIITSIGAVLDGVAFSFIIPFLFNKVNEITPKGTEALSTSILLIGANLGSSISPYGLLFLGWLSGTSSVNGIYFTGSLIFIIMGVISFLLSLKKVK